MWDHTSLLACLVEDEVRQDSSNPYFLDETISTSVWSNEMKPSIFSLVVSSRWLSKNRIKDNLPTLSRVVWSPIVTNGLPHGQPHMHLSSSPLSSLICRPPVYFPSSNVRYFYCSSEPPSNHATHRILACHSILGKGSEYWDFGSY